MSISIISSGSPRALNERIFNEIKSISKEKKRKRVILIVPERSKMDVERAYLEWSGLPGMIDTEILSFGRLCFRVLDEAGKTSENYIDESGKSMLIYRSLRMNENEMVAFRNLFSGSGFIAELLSVMGEMNRALIDPESLLKVCEKITDPISSRKIREIAIIMKSYEQELSRTGLKDPQDRYTQAARLLSLAGNSIREGSVKWPMSGLSRFLYADIFVLGFGQTRDFTPQEYLILQAFADNTNVTITAVSDSGNQVYSGGIRCIDGILKRYPDAKREHIKNVDQGTFRKIGEAYIAHRKPVLPKDAADQRIAIMSGKDVFSEVSLIAGQIKQLVAKENMRYSDILVMTADYEGYVRSFKRIFNEADIPVYLDEKKKLAQTALGRTISAILRTISGGWKRQHVISYLKSGFMNAAIDEIDEFENFILAAGIRYKRDFLGEDKYLAYKDGPKYIKTRDMVLGGLKILDNSISGCKTAEEYCNALMDFLMRERIEEKTETISEGLHAQGLDDEAAAAVKAWNTLLDLLEQTRLIAPDTEMDLKGFAGIILSGMEQAVSSTIPHYIDSVQVSPFRYLTGKAPKVLFAAGLDERKFPGRISGEGLLNDTDRELLSGSLDIALPSYAEDKSYEDMYTSLYILTCASERLYLSSPIQEDLCSPMIKFIRSSSYPHEEISWIQSPLPDMPQVFSIDSAIQTLSFADPDIRWKLLEDIFSRHSETASRIETLSSIHSRADRDIRLSEKNIRNKYGEIPLMSISQLEKYSLCPYMHFAEYLLRLRERDVREIGHLHLGNVLHSILDLAVKDFLEKLGSCSGNEERELVLRQYSEADHYSLAEKYMEKAITLEGMSMFRDKGNFASRGRGALRIAENALNDIFKGIYEDGFVPGISEWQFSPKKGNALEIDCSKNQKILFTGKIDRVDKRDGQFRIIDYKTGDRKIDPDLWYHGLSLQLPGYIAAYMAQNPDESPSDVAYMRLDRPIYSVKNIPLEKIQEKVTGNKKAGSLNKSKMTSEQLVLASGRTITQIKHLTENLLEGHYNVAPRKLERGNLPCEYCSYRGLCGLDKDCGKQVILKKLPLVKTAEGKRMKKQDVLTEMIKREDEDA